jgi:hypothetical protein
MNKFHVLSATTAVAAAALVTYYLRINRYITQVQERFPSLDRKTAQKAYLQFMKNASQNKYGDMSSFHDSKMDELFLDIVREIQNPLRKK